MENNNGQKLIFSEQVREHYIKLVTTHMAISKGFLTMDSMEEISKEILYAKLNANPQDKKHYSLFYISGDGWKNKLMDIVDVLNSIHTIEDCRSYGVMLADLAETGQVQNLDAAYLTGLDEINSNNIDEANEMIINKIEKIHGSENCDSIQGDRVNEEIIKEGNKMENKNANLNSETEVNFGNINFEESTVETEPNFLESLDWKKIATYAAATAALALTGVAIYNLVTEKDIVILDANDL